MSISPLNGSASTLRQQPASPPPATTTFEQTLQTAESTDSPDALAPHVLTHHDPLTKYLTTQDVATFKSMFGVDFKANGDIMVPMSRGVNQFGATMAAAGQIASDRAHGKLTGPITPEFVTQLVQTYRFRLDHDQPLFPEPLSDREA